MREFTRHRLNSSGFTLSELLVVIGVVVVLSAIAVPAFSRWIPQYRLKEAARDLYSTMQLMKMSAVKNNQPTNIVFSTAPHQYQYSISGVTKTVVLSEYGSGVKYDNPDHTLTFTIPSSTLTYDARGFCNGGEVYLSNGENSDYFWIRPLTSGAINLLRHDGSEFH